MRFVLKNLVGPPFQQVIGPHQYRHLIGEDGSVEKVRFIETVGATMPQMNGAERPVFIDERYGDFREIGTLGEGAG